jgi:rhamnogalacturonyl hydrolase YesR
VAESSGTAFFVAGLSWGVAQGHLDAETYLPSIKKGWVALNEAVNDEGMIGWVQQVGYAPDKVAANETQFYGSGAFLLAGTELLKLSEAGMIETNTGAAR